ncbi:hypothetical protein [Derxia gummosa]|uniref:Uncharacterized protein n=1 Tax=Derxia gummosa DSM 723 TaxID=1121388 RepID=A0A8B6XCJ5_9BURK|nr:hypothetical protein [Derxia gummosa]
MTAQRGISLLDLLPQTTVWAGGQSDRVLDWLGALTVLDLRSTSSAAFLQYEGVLQSWRDAYRLNTTRWSIDIPGITRGLPFRLALARQPVPAPSAPASIAVEPALSAWTLDLVADRLAVDVPGLVAATRLGGSGPEPLHLSPARGQAAVRAIASGVLRLWFDGVNTVGLQLADVPDPFNPGAPTGAVLRLDMRPPTFCFGQTAFGMTLDNFTLDLSPDYTPPELAAAGKPASWTGAALDEARLYFPPGTPLLPNLSVGVRDLVVGQPGGLQGEASLEFGEIDRQTHDGLVALQTRDLAGVDTDISPAQLGDDAPDRYLPLGSADSRLLVRATFPFDPAATIAGYDDPPLAVREVRWSLPDGSSGSGKESPWFELPSGQPLRYRLGIGRAGVADPGPLSWVAERRIWFVAKPGDASALAGRIDLVLANGGVLPDVLHVRGPREALAGLVFKHVTAVPNDEAPDWQLGGGTGAVVSRSAMSFTLPMLDDDGDTQDLVLTDAHGLMRRVRIETSADSRLVIGHAVVAGGAEARVSVLAPPWTGAPAAAIPARVADGFPAAPFHRLGSRAGMAAAASFDALDGRITAPTGTAAEVEIRLAADPSAGAVVPPPAPAAPATSPNLQLRFDWDSDNPIGSKAPWDGSDATLAGALPERHAAEAKPLLGGAVTDNDHGISAVRAWVKNIDPEQKSVYCIVGRTDDLAHLDDLHGNFLRNRELGRKRAERARSLLIAAGIPPARIHARAESEAWPAGAPVADLPPRFLLAGDPAQPESTLRLALPPDRIEHAANTARPFWNARWVEDSPTGPRAPQAAREDSDRLPYRCADILCVDAHLAQQSPSPAPAPAPGGADALTALVLVPGADGKPAPVDAPLPGTTTPMPYRVALRARWDSPSLVAPADYLPVEAEARVCWQPKTIDIQGPGGTTTIPQPVGGKAWEVLLQWLHDARTGRTRLNGALSLPDGKLGWNSDALAWAMALGPTAMATMKDTDVVKDPLGQFVTATAMYLIGAGIGGLVNKAPQGQQANPGYVEIDRIAIGCEWNGDPAVSTTLDYTVHLRVNVGAKPVGGLRGDIRLGFRNVGLRYRDDRLSLTFDSMKAEVVDPGTWTLSGPLGDLVSVANTRMGNGSKWIEFDLAIARDLGVVKLASATLRLGIEPEQTLELRGLNVSVNIPNVLVGQGSVSIDDGSVRAGVALDILPAKLKANGALAIQQDFAAVDVGVKFPVPLLLGGTGLGVYGFSGRFVANGTRNVAAAGHADDPVERALAWWAMPPETKYARKPGQFALGLGSIIGTAADGGFSFNAEGALTVGFPELSVGLGIDAGFMRSPRSNPSAARPADAGKKANGSVLGMVLVEPDSVVIGARAEYVLPKVVSIKAPISAYFPLAKDSAKKTDPGWYLRIGSDGGQGRPGDPVRAVLLPGLLDFTAWAFLMLDEKGLHGLGAPLIKQDLVKPIDLDGFSVGMGAGFDLKWSAGPLTLAGSAFIVLGLGTRPLAFAGAAGLKAELDLVIVSVGVDGLLQFMVRETKSGTETFVGGHLCGSVQLLFFEVSGCIDTTVGKPPAPDAGVESPVAGLELCDHFPAVMASVAPDAGGGALPVVWPDTVPVLRFAHYIADHCTTKQPGDTPPTALPTTHFVRATEPAAPQTPWSGPTGRRTAYRLDAVQLWKLADPAKPDDAGSWTLVDGPFDCEWWLPSHRPALQSPDVTPPGNEEGRELALMTQDAAPWARWYTPDVIDAGLPSSPGKAYEQMCEPVPAAGAAWAWGADWHAIGKYWLGMTSAQPAPDALFPSHYDAYGKLAQLTPQQAAAWGKDAGWDWHPAKVAPLALPVVLDGKTRSAGWRLPCWRKAGAFMASAPVGFEIEPALASGALVLEVARERDGRPLADAGICDGMPARDYRFSDFTGVSATIYRGDMTGFADNGERAVHVFTTAMAATAVAGKLPGSITAIGMPRVDSVEIDLRAVSGTVAITAHDAGGRIIASRSASGATRQTLRIEVWGIARLVMTGVYDLYRVCWGKPRRRVLPDLLGLQDLAVPRVFATGADGKLLDLAASEIASADGGTRRVLRYKLPAGDWSALGVGAWPWGEIRLVGIEAVTRNALAAQAAEQAARDGLRQQAAEAAEALASGKPTHAVNLDADSTYEIRVEWSAQVWTPPANKPSAQPGPPAAAAWKSGPADRFRFRTAPYGLRLPQLPPPGAPTPIAPEQAGVDESRFDPRDLARYLRCATPADDGAPHFIGDEIGFWFMVDHLPALAAKYGRKLVAEVLDTRPPAGALDGKPPVNPGARHPLDRATGFDWKLDARVWFPADLEIAEAVAAAPCLRDANLDPLTVTRGSSRLDVAADLRPGGEYDLVLKAMPDNDGADPAAPANVVVARSHFRASRHATAAGLIGALGFSAAGYGRGEDAVVAQALAAPAKPARGDAAFEADLASLGLAPWPAADGARCTLLWLAPDAGHAAWRVAGLLVEADEPIRRAGFATGALNEPAPPARLDIASLVIEADGKQTPLIERGCNSAGSRLLYVPAAPFALGTAPAGHVTARFSQRGQTGAPLSFGIADRPGFVADEEA